MTKVKIISMNVNGLAQHTKCRKVLTFLSRKKPNIIFLQETHSIKDTEHIWTSQSNRHVVFAHGESNCHGTAILFEKCLENDIQKVTCHENGRYAIVDLLINEQIYTLANVYVPNNDSPDFFVAFFEKLKEHECINVIIGGDFNLVFDVNIDCTNINRNNNHRSLSVIKEVMT